MKVFTMVYRKYQDNKTVLIAARTTRAALDESEKFVKKNYADRVVGLTELHDNVILAK